MRFAAIALATGLVGTFLAANLQGTLSSSVAEAASLTKANSAETAGLDTVETGSIAASSTPAASDAIRLIDLRSGTTCKSEGSTPALSFTNAPLGRDCKSSPSLSRIAQWRSTADGSLIMADSEGAIVLEFAPGDGVLYESVYPADQLITIVPARG